MRRPDDWNREELISIARQVQRELYLDVDDRNRSFWNPDKSWDGADICDTLASLLNACGLAPDQVLPGE